MDGCEGLANFGSCALSLGGGIFLYRVLPPPPRTCGFGIQLEPAVGSEAPLLPARSAGKFFPVQGIEIEPAVGFGICKKTAGSWGGGE